MFCKKCGHEVAVESKFCEKCGENLSENAVVENVEIGTDKIDFFVVPTARLIIFSILSLGWYSIYWFAKNFQAIEKSRKNRGSETYSIVGGIFSTLTAGILFNEFYLVHKKITGKDFSTPYWVFAILYFVLVISAKFVSLSFVVFIVMALIFQSKLKKYKNPDVYTCHKAKFKWAEVGMVILGLLIFTLSFLIKYSEIKNANDFASGKIQASQLNYTLMQGVADNINKDTPKMIDSETRLDTVVGGDNTLSYYYTLVNYDVSGVDVSVLNKKIKASLVSSICNNKNMEIYVKNKSTLNYIYNDKNGLFITNISVYTGTDCKK